MTGKTEELLKGSTPPPWISWPHDARWDAVVSYGEQQEWPAKAVLYRYGDRADALILIQDGIVGILALGMNGVQRNIGNLGPGSILGEAAFFNDGIYRHGMRCIVPCSGIVFSRRTILENLLPNYPELSLYVFRNLAAKSYMMSTQLEAASFMSSEQQLAHFLWHLGLEQEKDSSLYRNIAAVSLSRLGEMLGMHRVTVTRLMNALKKEGAISTAPCIRILDAAYLERVFAGG